MEGTPGTTPTAQEAVAAMAVVRAWAAALPGHVGQVQEPDVSSVFEELSAVQRSVEAARVCLTAEAATRGLPCNTGPFGSMGGDLKAWVAERSPGVPAGEVCRLVKVVNAGRVRGNAPLLEAVTAGRVGLAAAEVALGEMSRVRPLLNPDHEI